MRLPTSLWPLRCACRFDEAKESSRSRKSRKPAKKTSSAKKRSREPEEADDGIIVLEKIPTSRQGRDEDYAKTVDDGVLARQTDEAVVMPFVADHKQVLVG